MDDGNDTVVVNGSLGGLVFGDDGDDVITGSDTNQSDELMFGGDGADQINTRNVGQAFPPGTIPNSAATDGFCCDPLQPVGDNATGDDGGDVIVTGNGDDFVGGDQGLESLSGRSTAGGDGFNTGADQIATGAGDDFAAGDCGDGDRIDLGPGNDSTTTFAHDGNGDVSEGGPGIDQISFNSTLPRSAATSAASTTRTGCRSTISTSTWRPARRTAPTTRPSRTPPRASRTRSPPPATTSWSETTPRT